MEPGRLCNEAKLSAKFWPIIAALFFLLVALGACEASDRVGTCIEGQLVPCPCSDGTTGFQICASGGLSQSPCQCGQGISGTGIAGTELSNQPTSGSGVTEQPAGGTEVAEQPFAGDGSELSQGTGGIEPVDAGIEQPQIFDSGQTFDGGPGPGAQDTSLQPTETDSGGAVQPNPDQDEVPATDHCAPVSNWDPAWVAWEEEVLTLTNEVRAQGADCGVNGSFGPAPALSMNPELRCSARLHSMDMAQRGFFDHINPDGVDPSRRITAAGYAGFMTGENIAQGYPSPAAVVAGWVDSDGHCANMMSPMYTDIGVGYYTQPSSGWFGGPWWTQNFGGSGGGGTWW